MSYLDADSQAEFKAALERSLSTRQPGREGVSNQYFERNTPRSKSLGRGLKGTRDWVAGGVSDTHGGGTDTFRFGIPFENNSLNFRPNDHTVFVTYWDSDLLIIILTYLSYWWR